MPKGHSGIRRGSSSGGIVYTKEQIAQLIEKDKEYLQELAKKGEMPRSNFSFRDSESRGKAILAYELIDKYYAMPSQEYLAQAGIRLTSWQKEYIEGIGAVRSMHIQEERSTGFYVSVPYRANKSAMNGALKIRLYYELKNMHKLQRKQFKLPSKRQSSQNS